MKYLLLASLLATGTVHAAALAFWAAPDGSYTCSTYCSGFGTSKAGHLVGFVNITQGTVQMVHGVWKQSHTYTLSIDGVSHRASNVFSPFKVDGLTISVTFATHTTCTTSGRGQHC